ncbi:phosphomannomutase [Allisonella histaminiformans]|uniref:phosphomannomutase n=1 Tax=Allisonella histaminiformans TaxID=209880 RepID=UPI0026EC3925|nr:phosphomannomutase [Allisonella histaminiformans]
MNELHMAHTGFKAYDIRGVIPDEINEELAYRVGRAYAELYHPKTMCVGYDVRKSSQAFCKAVCDGLTDGGVHVYNIGLCGTEMVYFTTFYYKLDGGIMITASHNPSNCNGLKIVREKGKPVSSDTGLKEVEKLAFSGDFGEIVHKGTVEKKDILDDYVQHLLSYVDVSRMKPLHIVVNAGNGCANVVFSRLKEHLPIHFTEMLMQPDGDFPNGVPNPMLPENRQEVIKKVLEVKADMGIAWDGDFDRCFFFDENGKFIEGYYMVGLLATYFLEKHPGETIIHDPRLYWNTQKIVAECGGKAVESKGGHAFMKETMRRVHGIYGAEMSAHHFFRDFSYCDSGMIPWLIVAQLVSETGISLADMVSHMEEEFPCSGEINLPASDTKKVLAAVRDKYAKDAVSVDTIDGIGINFENWRFNLRPSNTEPLIRFNLETRGDRKLMEEKRDEIVAFVKTLL